MESCIALHLLIGVAVKSHDFILLFSRQLFKMRIDLDRWELVTGLLAKGLQGKGVPTVSVETDLDAPSMRCALEEALGRRGPNVRVHPWVHRLSHQGDPSCTEGGIHEEGCHRAFGKMLIQLTFVQAIPGRVQITSAPLSV
jgi:hypothetical protein